MTWLFIRFYFGVLVVLFLAWFIYGAVLEERVEADLSRVIIQAHAGGARLVARELDAADQSNRAKVLDSIQKQFGYPVEIVAVTDLPAALQDQLAVPAAVVHFHREDNRHLVLTLLADSTQAVQLGPFPNYDLAEIEASLAGWMRLAASELESQSAAQQASKLAELEEQFEINLELINRDQVPESAHERVQRGRDVVFYQGEDERYYSVVVVPEQSEVIRFGPYPSFERSDQKAATATLALVLLPAALAIALLLRPVTRQLRRLEQAAKTIASGDLSVRVEESRMRSARPLAIAFNDMADRTETLVRTQRELLQAVSHELRTPLARMRFAIDLIETAADEQERKRRLDSLDAATSELDELVAELLSYVRMETSEPRLTLEPIVVQEIVQNVFDHQTTLQPHVQFRFEQSDVNQPAIVVADRTGLRRVIGNLVGNAARFAREQVIVRFETQGEWICIAVDDDGIGIPASDRERVFNPFVRIDDGSNGSGAGLGLALVRRILKQHGGTATAAPSPLGGCRLSTLWPLER